VRSAFIGISVAWIVLVVIMTVRDALEGRRQARAARRPAPLPTARVVSR
jgi:hypothetical protein